MKKYFRNSRFDAKYLIHDYDRFNVDHGVTLFLMAFRMEDDDPPHEGGRSGDPAAHQRKRGSSDVPAGGPVV